MGKFTLRKSADDSYSLLIAFSNRWRDWDFHADPEHGGEIVSSKAHEEYVEWLDKNPQHAPQLWIWHVPGSQFKHRANWWAWSGNFLYANWQLTEEEARFVEEWAKDETLGASFGFYVLDYDLKDGTIDRYRAFETSILPVVAAANKWTTLNLVGLPLEDAQENRSRKMISQKQYEALARLHGKEFADSLVENDRQIAELLDAAGVESKEATEAPAEEVAVETQAAEVASEEVQAEAAVEAEKAVAEVTEDKVVAALARLESVVAGDMKTLLDRITVLEAKLAAKVQADGVERKAAAMPPSLLQTYMPRSILDVGAGAADQSQQKSSAVVDGRSSLAKQGPKAAVNSDSWFAALQADIRN